MNIIIGITGTLGSGKGTVVDYLVKNHGFAHFSARAFITEELEKKNIPVSRDSLVSMGNELREKHDPSYVATSLFDRASKQDKPAIIESLRTVGEIEALRKKGDFYLLAIDANPEVRYERIVGRATETDKISYEEFLGNEQREMTSSDPNKQNLSKCIDMADFLLDNSGDLENLNRNIETIFQRIQKVQKRKEWVRPSWDEYFMELADTAAKRATCDRGRSGCVIVKDKNVLVTGYVGSPKGLDHCDEVGHQMKTVVHEDGHKSQHCVRTIHAEQNAIVQAAKRGIAIEGSTLYCKMTPCRVCAMLIINAGIKRVVCKKKYHAGGESEEMFKEAGVKLEILDESIEKYENQ